MKIKRDEKGRFVKGTPAPNPKGRPKDDESWAGIFRTIGDMTTDEILDFIPKNNPLGRAIQDMPKNVQMKYLVGVRVFTALMFEPSSGLVNAVTDRVDGKVSQPIDMSTREIKVTIGDDNE